MDSIRVSNISPQLQDTHLRELFGCCGEIKSMTLNNNGECDITYVDPAHAQAAVFLSGTPLGDRVLTVVAAPKSATQESQPFNGLQPRPGVQATTLLQTAENLGITNLPQNAQDMLKGRLATDVSAESTMVNQIVSQMGKAAMESAGLRQAAEKRADEVARTVYIGNLAINLDANTVRDFFERACGPTLHTKMAGTTVNQTVRFAFVEFKSVESAQKALAMTGHVLGGLPIRVGKAHNPIFTPDNDKNAAKKAQIAKILKEQQEKISAKLQKAEARKSRRSRSRSRGRRRRRSRSRSRGRRRRSRRSRSRSRDRRRSRSPPIREEPEPKPKGDHEGEFFNGYRWQKIEDLEEQGVYVPGVTKAPPGGVLAAAAAANANPTPLGSLAAATQLMQAAKMQASHQNR